MADSSFPWVRDLSTGYLQDALLELRDGFKRRSLLVDPEHNRSSQTTSVHDFSDEPMNTSVTRISESAMCSFAEMETTKEDSEPATVSYSSSHHGIKNSITEEKRKTKKVAYPFEVVKAGIVEGEVVTLKEINRRILMRPARAVKHPVGDFACRPFLSNGRGGAGLSGKAVVALTRIHTQGRGSITIIRTKG